MQAAIFCYTFIFKYLQCTFYLEPPGFQQRFGYVFAVFIAASPFAQARGPNVLIRRELEFLHCLLKRCYNGDDRPNGLRFAPVRITASPCHVCYALPFRNMKSAYFITKGLDSRSPPLVSILYNFRKKEWAEDLLTEPNITSKTTHYKAFLPLLQASFD